MSDTITLRVTKSLSGLAGVRYPLPENHPKWSKPRQFLWSAYVDVINVACLFEIASLIFRISQSPDDLGIVCACSVGAGYALHLLLKLCIFKRNRDLFARLFDEICDISEELSRNPFHSSYIDFYDSDYMKIVRTAFVKGGFELFATATLIIIFIIRGLVFGVPEDVITPALTWTPYDNSENPAYSLTCTFELIVYWNVTMRNAAIDLLFWLMLMVPTIQLKYLNLVLRLIVKEEEVRESSGAVVAEGEDFNSRFVWWVKYHQRVLSMIQEFRAITSPFLAVNYLTTLLILSMAGLVAISTTSWNIFQQVIINGIVMSNTLQLYFVSLTGDWMSESSETAAEGGFSALIVYADRAVRSNYLFACARTKHCLQIRFGGINRLCSDTFAQLIRLTMTYFVTIVQLRNEENQPDS